MPRRPPAADTCVLYDPSDGGIHLVHTVVTFAGAQRASWKSVEKEAREILVSSRRDRSGLKSLRANARTLAPGVDCRVVRGKLTRTP